MNYRLSFQLVITFLVCLCSAYIHMEQLHAQAPPAAVPDEAAQGIKDIPLEGPVTDTCAGANGQYVLLAIASQQKVVAIDVKEMKIHGTIPTTSKNFCIAAGKTKALLLDCESGSLSRWDLASLKEEATEKIPLPYKKNTLLLGCNSEGPALLGTNNGDALELDLSKLKINDIRFQYTDDVPPGIRAKIAINNRSRISPDGIIFASDDTYNVFSTILQPDGTRKLYSLRSGVGGVTPSFNGQFLITRKGIFRKDLWPINLSRWGESGYREDQTFSYVPSVDGPFYLKIPFFGSGFSDPRGKPAVTGLHIFGNGTRLSDVPQVEAIHAGNPYQDDGMLLDIKRVIFISSLNKILCLSQDLKSLRCIDFDCDQILKQTPADYLSVVSQPPEQTKAGSTYEYPLAVLSKSQSLKYELALGPKGMQFDAAGKLTWKSGKNEPPYYDIIARISSDSGLQTYHTFRLNIEGGKPQEEPKSPPPLNTASAKSPKVETAKFEGEKTEVSFPGTYDKLVAGGSGRYLIGKLLDRVGIAVVDVTQAKVTSVIPCDDPNALIAAGLDKMLLYSPMHNILIKYNLATSTVEQVANNPFTGKIEYMAMASGLNDNPLIIFTATNRGFTFGKAASLDINNLKPIELSFPPTSPSSMNGVSHIFAANSANLFSVFTSALITLKGAKAESRGDLGGIPFANGQHMFDMGSIIPIQSSRTSLSSSSDIDNAIPAISGDLYLSFIGKNKMPGSNTKPIFVRDGEYLGANLYRPQDTEPIASFPNIPFNRHTQDFTNKLVNELVYFIPQASVVAILKPGTSTLEMYRLDANAALSNSSKDFILVNSSPNTLITPGKPFNYKLDVLAKSKTLKYAKKSGPAGLQVSADGSVSWAVPKKLNPLSHDVVISIKNAEGLEVQHAFTLATQDAASEAVKLEAAKKQAESQAQIAAETTQQEDFKKLKREQMKKRMEVNRAAAREVKPRNLSNTAEDSPQAAEEQRTWTDSTGKIKIKATFVGIENQTTVLLTDEAGAIKKVPLTRLSSADAYYAVQAQIHLDRINPKANSAAAKDIQIGFPIADETRTQIDSAIQRMMSVVEKLDPDQFASEVLHPISQKLIADKKLDLDLDRLDNISSTLIQANSDPLIWEDPQTIHLGNTLVYFRMHEGKWMLLLPR